MKRFAVLIMAAGASSRFGGCKLLAPVEGRPLLQRTIGLAAELFPDDIYVVSGAWHRELMDAKVKGKLAGASFVYVDTWSHGLSASLVAGVKYLKSDYNVILVLLADQVALERSDLERLLAAFDGDNIACGFYNGKRGVPAIFGDNSFGRLMHLRGDQGAKEVLYEPSISVRECFMPNASMDIDSRDQLAEWKNDSP
jgi:molybdenum cofactor cytidylyltransferase